jgi:hypothetical protein
LYTYVLEEKVFHLVMDADVCLFLGFVLHVGITIGSHRPHRHNYDHAQMEPPFLKVTMVLPVQLFLIISPDDYS